MVTSYSGPWGSDACSLAVWGVVGLKDRPAGALHWALSPTVLSLFR